MPTDKQFSAGRRQTRFDALKLSASGESLTGSADARDFPRLADRLAQDARPARIDWRLTGGTDGQRRPLLTLTLAGSVPLICQRCLQPFVASVNQTTSLLLARSEAELKRLDAEEVEVILATDRLDPLALIEDELLLSLPFSPRHDQGECEPVESSGGPQKNEGRVAPFGKLAQLRKTTG